MTMNSLSSPSCCSSSCIYRLLNPPVRFGASASATFHGHGWLSIVKLSRIRHNEDKQVLPQLGLQQSNQTLVHCSSALTTSSSSGLAADPEITLFSLFQGFGIGAREAELILGNNSALRFSDLSLVRARLQSLQQIGITGFALSRLISKRPLVLTAQEIDSFICFVKDDLECKIEAAQLERLLNTTEPRFLVGFEEKVRLLLHHGIPREKLPHVLNNVNLTKALCLKSADEIERTFNFFKRFGGVVLIVRRPTLLNYDLETQLIPRVSYLTDLSGGDEQSTGTVLRKLPAILAYTADHCRQHVEFLKSYAGLTEQQIFRIVLVYPNLFSASRKRKLQPRIDFLKQCGLDSHEIFKFLIKAPLFLSLSFEENLAHKLVFLMKIGYEHRTKDLAIAMGAVTRTNCKNFQEVVSLFLNYGLSCEDILAMSKKHPQTLQYNHESLEEKIDYLLEEMGREIEELLAFPAFLGYKLDSRIKLRYEMKKKILGEGMSLNKLLSESAERFSMKKEKKGSPVL